MDEAHARIPASRTRELGGPAGSGPGGWRAAPRAAGVPGGAVRPVGVAPAGVRAPQRSLAAWVAALVLFGAGILAVLHAGGERFPPTVASPGPASTADRHPGDPLGTLLLQLVVVLTAARAAGAAARRIGQPAVVGEMLAGIVLGPSLLGWLAPGAHAVLFPAASMDALGLLSQLGVVVFMFVVGMELDVAHLRARAHAAILVSHASIVVPFFLGTAFALGVYGAVAPPGIPFAAFAAFMGIAMSVTAFPVLARILAERGLAGSALGTTAIACAAIDDVTAWCLLAVVVAGVRAGDAAAALGTIGLTLGFAAGMLLVLRPRAERLFGRGAVDGGDGAALVGALSLVFACALVTEAIGIHALFGAFMAGIVVPARPGLREHLRRHAATVSAVLLPLFFACTGLRTQVTLLDDRAGWLLCGAIVAIAVVGKLGAGALAARFTGLGWWDALALGALMNTRGLVELVVLNVGWDLGILPPRVFTALVLMALLTTVMTGPFLSLFGRLERAAAAPGRRP